MVLVRCTQASRRQLYQHMDLWSFRQVLADATTVLCIRRTSFGFTPKSQRPYYRTLPLALLYRLCKP